MVSVINDKLLSFEDLRELKDEKLNKIYSEELINELEKGNFEFLNRIDLTDRNNREFMQPLLYAVKNSRFDTKEELGERHQDNL